MVFRSKGALWAIMAESAWASKNAGNASREMNIPRSVIAGRGERPWTG